MEKNSALFYFVFQKNGEKKTRPDRETKPQPSNLRIAKKL